MKVLVTGASGTVGGRVVRRLSGDGVTVRAVARRPGSVDVLREHALAGVEPVAADLGDAAAVRALFDDVDAAFLVTANVADQLAQEQAVIRAAAQAGVRRVVKLSVAGAAPDAPLALARVHHAAEQELAASGVAYTLLRPAFFMDNLLQFTPWIEPSGRLALPLGDGAVPMIDSRDIADVAAVELGNSSAGNRDLRLTGPEDLTAASALSRIGEVVGRSLQYVDSTREDFLRRYLADGNSADYAQDIAELYDGILRHGYGAGTTDVVREVTGHQPRTITDFARERAAAFTR
ncbi:NAD(P)H-binding protein [Nonomuraea angiospora]|uniref:NmrA family NAD(P)-binding protein n=1 Tax=Nonomuraea angiospora TaxID=46172 RepID=UPI003436E08A